jgi:hypothetical protein
MDCQKHFSGHFVGFYEMSDIRLAVTNTSFALASGIKWIEVFTLYRRLHNKSSVCIDQSFLLLGQSKWIGHFKPIDSELSGLLNVVDATFTCQTYYIMLSSLLALFI